jgi:hypothetical protein
VAYDPYNRRFPDRWHLNGVSDEVVRCVLAARTQMKREMPESAGPSDLVIASLFVAHELLANNWKAVNAAGVKERSFKLAEAIADITQVLVDLTGRWSGGGRSGRLPRSYRPSTTSEGTSVRGAGPSRPSGARAPAL